MRNGRPRREDIPDDVDPADVLYELRLFWWEFMQYRAEANGDLTWLKIFRARASEVGKVGLLLLPIGVAAWLGLHL
jgi:hypothetical protein